MYFLRKFLEDLLIILVLESIIFVVVPFVMEMSFNSPLQIEINLLPVVEFLKEKKEGYKLIAIVNV